MEYIKIRSINKIAFLRAKNVIQNEIIVDNNMIVYKFEDNQKLRDELKRYFLNVDLKETLGKFNEIRREIGEKNKER